MIEITPATTSLLAETTQQFAASLAGVASVQVTWSISEGADGGSIDSSGLYTAPMTGGTFHVVASPVGVEATPGMATVDVDRPPPGSLDTSFADGGVLIFDPLPGGYCPRTPCAAAILILDGGIIAVAGTEESAGGTLQTVVVEVDNTGAVVPGFRVSGGNAVNVHSFATQPSGQFLLAGIWSFSDGSGAVERRNANGTIDQGFGDAGLIFPAVNTIANATPLLVLPDSGFLVGDDRANDAGATYLAVTEFSADGVPEGTTPFSSSQPDLGQIAEQFVSVQSSGTTQCVLALSLEIVATGTHVVAASLLGTSVSNEVEDISEVLPFQRAPYISAVASNQEWVVAVEAPAGVVRLGLDAGGFDAAFEARATAAIGGLDAGSLMGVVVGADSKPIFAMVSNDLNWAQSLLLLRLDSQGALDLSFGDGGWAAIPLGVSAEAEALALEPDGKLLIVGRAGQHWTIARCWP